MHILWTASRFIFSIDSKYGRTMWFYDQVILIIWRLQINATVSLEPLGKSWD